MFRDNLVNHNNFLGLIYRLCKIKPKITKPKNQPTKMLLDEKGMKLLSEALIEAVSHLEYYGVLNRCNSKKYYKGFLSPSQIHHLCQLYIELLHQTEINPDWRKDPLQLINTTNFCLDANVSGLALILFLMRDAPRGTHFLELSPLLMSILADFWSRVPISSPSFSAWLELTFTRVYSVSQSTSGINSQAFPQSESQIDPKSESKCTFFLKSQSNFVTPNKEFNLRNQLSKPKLRKARTESCLICFNDEPKPKLTNIKKNNSRSNKPKRKGDNIVVKHPTFPLEGPVADSPSSSITGTRPPFLKSKKIPKAASYSPFPRSKYDTDQTFDVILRMGIRLLIGRKGEAALQLFEEAARRGSIRAYYWLGRIIYYGEAGIIRDEGLGLSYFRTGVAKGDMACLTELGTYHYRRARLWGEESRIATAYQCFLTASKNGDAAAKFLLGLCHIEQRGPSSSNIETGWYLMEQAARDGYFNAQIYMDQYH